MWARLCSGHLPLVWFCIDIIGQFGSFCTTGQVALSLSVPFFTVTSHIQMLLYDSLNTYVWYAVLCH